MTLERCPKCFGQIMPDTGECYACKQRNQRKKYFEENPIPPLVYKPLSAGIDPPANHLMADVQINLEPIPCTKCGRLHGMVVSEMATGKYELLDLCEDCIFEGCHWNHDPNFDINKVKLD